jgi:membrane associated rhomboid family serine protease
MAPYSTFSRGINNLFIVPINEDGYIGRTPLVIICVAVLNVLALAATYLFFPSQTVFSHYGFTPAEPQALTALSSMFLHAGLFHLLGNMFFLWMFGYRIENTFGRWGFGLIYLLCGIGAVSLHYVFNRASTVPCVGASGAISGIMGCYFVLFPESRFDLEVFFLRFHVASIPSYTRGAIGIWVAEQTILGLMTQTVRFSTTAFWAHVGGFATGAAITLPLLWLFPHLKIRGEQPFMVRNVKGVVHDLTGSVLSKANVDLRSESGEVLTATTDSQGRFSFPNLPDGCYTFTASRDGWEAVEGNILVRRKRRYSLPIKVRMQHQVSNYQSKETETRLAKA